MKLNQQLFVMFLILLPSQTVSAAINHSPWKVAAELTKEMESMGYTITSKNNSGELSFRQSKGAVEGEFVLGKEGTVTVPAWKSQGGKWVQSGTTEAIFHRARVRIRLYTAPVNKTPKSLKRYAKKPRDGFLIITRKGNPAPSLEEERIPYTETVAYTKSRQNGTEIERVITSNDGPRMRIVGSGAASFTELAGTAGAPGTLVQITLPYDQTRFGNVEQRVFVANILVHNGRSIWAVKKYAKHDEIEAALFRAMANAWPEEITSILPDEGQSQVVSEKAEEEPKPDLEAEPEQKSAERRSTPSRPLDDMNSQNNILACPEPERAEEGWLGSSSKNRERQTNKSHLSTIKDNALHLKVEFIDGNPLYFPGNENAWSGGNGVYPKLTGRTTIDQLSFKELFELDEERKGIAADGASQIVVALHSGVEGKFEIELLPEAFGKEGVRPEPGKIRLLRDGKTCDTGKGHVAFAVYTAPTDFGRRSGMGAPTGWLRDGKERLAESRVEWLDIIFKPQSGDVLKETEI